MRSADRHPRRCRGGAPAAAQKLTTPTFGFLVTPLPWLTPPRPPDGLSGLSAIPVRSVVCSATDAYFILSTVGLTQPNQRIELSIFADNGAAITHIAPLPLGSWADRVERRFATWGLIRLVKTIGEEIPFVSTFINAAETVSELNDILSEPRGEPLREFTVVNPGDAEFIFHGTVGGGQIRALMLSSPEGQTVTATRAELVLCPNPLWGLVAVTPAPTDPAGADLPFVIANSQWTPVIQSFDGVEMVLVPPGRARIGSSSGGDADERPAHNVDFEAPFWIDRYEVTNEQFARFRGQAVRASAWPGADRPRENITWAEARDFCARRGARLPTEAEWEYAARGPDGLTYPWGDTFIADNVVYRDNSGGQTASAGSRPGGVSWVGALDMSGNVREWTSSLHLAYPYRADDGREADTDGRQRVLRGGSWASIGDDVRAAIRHSYRPDNLENSYGFRCARSY